MRELHHVEIVAQAEALAEYLRRGGDEARWWQSKHFAEDDAREIRRVLAQRTKGAA